MTVLRRATGGAAWTVAAGLLSRGIGMLGTLLMTHYLAPQVMGEVTTATVLAFTANWLTQLGLTQYVMLRADGAPDRIFHATVLSMGLVAVALALIAAASPLLGAWFETPDLVEYLPGMALAVLIRRAGSIPDKLLLRRMRFRTVALANAAGELVYVGCALALVALTSLGGHSIVVANIVQACVTTGILVAACGVKDWLTPARLRWNRFREILQFGLPLGVESFFYEAARYADKLVFTKLFGAGRTGEYNLAYNLADIPASQVGEQVSNVMLPTLLQFEGARRREVLVRSIGLLSLITFPMAVGLGVIAPTLIEVLLPPHWQGVAPFLLVLAVVSLFRPINGLLSQYLISIEEVRVLMRLEIVRVIVLFGGMIALGRLGPVPAALAVGVSSLVHLAVLTQAVAPDRAFTVALLKVLRAPLVGCSGMAAIVLVVRAQLESAGSHDLAMLAIEVLTGAACYVGCLFLLERAALRDVTSLALGLVREAVGMTARGADLRLRELDALRGIAALSVLLFHYANQFEETYHHLGRFPFTFGMGKYGVQLFFVISGFVIFWTLDRTRRAGDFIAHRFARLYPAYWASLALTVGLVSVAGLPNQQVGAWDILLNMTMFPDFLSARAVDGSYWTLQIELFFYAQMLLWFALGALGRIRWVIAGWLLLAATYAIAQHQGTPLSYTLRELLVVRYAHCFAVGILMFRMREQGGGSALDWLLLAAAHLVSWLTWGGVETVVLGICTVLFLLMNAGRLAILAREPLLFLGGISFTLYLLHQEIGYIFISGFEHVGLGPVASILATTALMVLLAWMLSRYLERPANRLLRSLYDRWRGPVSPAPAERSA